MKISNEKNDLWTWRHTFLILSIFIFVWIVNKGYGTYLNDKLENRKTELNVGVREAENASLKTINKTLQLRNDLLKEQNETLFTLTERLQDQNTMLWKILGKPSKGL